MKRVLIIISYLLLTGIIKSQENYETLLRSKALIDNGKAAEAINMLSGVIFKSQDHRIFLLRADAHTATGNYQGASNDYEEANNLAPLSGEYGLSRIYALRRDAKTALAHLEKNLSSPFKKSEKEILLDPAFSTIENTTDWRLFWKTERYNLAEKKISEIQYYVSKGNREEAVEALKELSGQFPGDDKTLYAKAMVDYSLKKYSESVTALATLLSKDRNNIEYLLLLGNVQVASGNMAGASSTYTRLIDLEYMDAGLFLKRAECYRKTQEFEKASRDLEKYLSLYPESKEAISLAGRIKSEQGDNLMAIELFSRNLKLHPNDPECYIDRANSYFVSRTWDYAISDYSMALDLKPVNPDVWLNKGIALLSIGRLDDACYDFRKALDMGNKKAASYISKNCIK